MSTLFSRDRTPADDGSAAAERDQVTQLLSERLASLDGKCLEGLAQGLHHAVDGDYTVKVTPVTTPIEMAVTDPAQAELVRLFNSMLAKAQSALEGYGALREELNAALGDQSCLGGLTERLHSLSDKCLAGLGEGLKAAAAGDLTVEAIPVTQPLTTRPGSELESWGACSTRCSAKRRAAFTPTTICAPNSPR